MKMQNILSKTATLILAGGRGERLSPLTRDRSKPAVPFGDRCIIDFVLTNCLQSSLKHPFILTQYRATHLSSHVRRWWLQHCSSRPESATPVCVPAPKTEYKGTANALLRNLELLGGSTEYVLVLSADHIYEMDYRELLEFHCDRAADVTLGTIVHPRESSRQFGILEVDGADRVIGFEEKPKHPKEMPDRPGSVLANMGIYVFRRDTLIDSLRRDAMDSGSAHDIGRNILPTVVSRFRTHAFRFEDPGTGKPRYWRDVGTLDSYYEASMEWLEGLPHSHRLAGSSSVISDGVRIHHTAEVEGSVLMPGVVVGAHARIRRAIIGDNVRVMRGAYIGFGETTSLNRQCSEKGVWAIPANTTVTAEGSPAIVTLLKPETQTVPTFS